MHSKISLLVLLPLLFIPSALAFDINTILSQFSDFSTMNSFLTDTHLAAEINSRQTITVLAVDDAAISQLSGQPSDVLKRLLALHVVLDYFDLAKLHQLPNKTTLLTTLFQATGQASGQTGFLNATDMGDGQIALGSAVPGSPLNANVVKVLATQPYNISVVQISGPIVPPGIAGGSSNHSSSGSATQKSPTLSAESPSSASPAPSSGGASPTATPSVAKSPPPDAAATPKHAPKAGSPVPAQESSAPASAPAEESGAPVESSPLPSAATSPTSSVADAPGPAAGGNVGSSAARVVVGTGVAALMGAALLGAL